MSAKELKIITYPNSILDTPSPRVKFPLDNQTKELIANMWKTVEGKGVGLAAPQVGVNKQICIIHLGELAQKNSKKSSFVMINPEIKFYSEIENQMVEGCLSFPDQFYRIIRPANIAVEYYNESGQKEKLKAKDWLSRVIQHEVDHLNGKLFINLGGLKLNPEDFDESEIVD